MTSPAPSPSPSPQAGGFLLVLAILIGTGVGAWQGQPSIGLLAGTSVGVLIALGVWLRDKRGSRIR
jgi:hypothetical protein